MMRNVLQNMGGHIEAYPIISLVIFFSFFLGMLLWVIGLSRNHVQHMSHLPLESESGDTRHE